MRKLLTVLFLFIGSASFAQSIVYPADNTKVPLNFGSTVKTAFVNDLTKTYASIAAMLAATVPPDSTIVVSTNYYNDNDNVKTEWIYLASSSTPTNGMTVLGTTGRYKLIIRNNKVTMKQLGIFPSADNSTAIQAAVNLTSSLNIKLSVDANSTFRIFNIRVPSYTYITGEDTLTSVLKAKNYTQNGQDMIGYYGGVNNVATSITIEGITIDGNVKYALDTVAAGTGSNDSTSRIITILYARRVTINNCVLKNGGNGGGILYSQSPDLRITNNYFDSIGGVPVFNYYDSTSYRVYVGYNTIHHYASRHHYDPGNPSCPWRNGDVWVQAGGKDFTAEYNDIYNDNLNRWFSVESRHTGLSIYRHNTYHSFGVLSGGYSLVAGNSNTNLVIEGNQDMDFNNYSTYTRKDSLIRNGIAVGKLYDAGNYDELSGFGSLKYFNNIRNGCQISTGYTANNAIIESNTFDNSAMNPLLANGTGNFISIGLGSGSDTICHNTIIRNNKVLLGPGTRYLSVLAASYVTDLVADDDVEFIDTVNANNSIAVIRDRVQGKVTISGRWRGKFGFTAFSTNNLTSRQIIDISKADFSRTNLNSDTTTAGNLIRYTGVRPAINRDGTHFQNAFIFHDLKSSIATITSAYTIGGDDGTIKADATSATFTVTLPTAVGITGKTYTVVRTNSGSNLVTLATTASQTINGASTYTGLSAQYKNATLQSDGANWIITANN